MQFYSKSLVFVDKMDNNNTIEPLFQALINKNTEIGKRYQIIFELKSINSDQAISKLIQSYGPCHESILLTHEILYALGQLQEDKLPLIKEFLISIVNNQAENSLSRHQAAQALANYFLPELKELYESHLKSTCNQLRWTCEIAVEKVKHLQLKGLYGKQYFGTKEPAAPFSNDQFHQYLQSHGLVQEFKEKSYLGILLKAEIPLFIKYRIMYLMRNVNTEEARKTLCLLLSNQYYQTQTSLLKHEICFILGQIGCQNYEHLIRECIQNEKEESIVRHQALAAVASQSKDIQYLDKFMNYPDQLIRQSAQVAQFTIKYWHQ